MVKNSLPILIIKKTNPDASYTNIPLRELSHSVYYSWSSLELNKCYAISQIGYEIKSQVPIGNRIYRTYTDEYNFEINPMDSYKILPLCPKEGIHFYEIVGVDKDQNLFNLIDRADILLTSGKERIFDSSESIIESAEK